MTTHHGAGRTRRSVPLLTVVYTGEPDEVFDFPHEGHRRSFGRSDTQCDIVIWSAINGIDLARTAGLLFRMDDELWVRNLAESHALHLQVPGRPPEPPLPPRPSATARGAARSIPGPECLITAPGGCELLVRQEHDPAWPDATDTEEPVTRRSVPDVPEELRPVAVAVCRPLLEGGRLPATYSEVAQALGSCSARTARRLVGELCLHYDTASRDPQDADPPSRSSRTTGGRRTFALPSYYELAHLLVDHHRIGVDDLGLLPVGAQ